MRTFLTAAASAALLSGAALAADSAQTEVFADIEEVCTITTQSAQIDLTNAAPDTSVAGTFTYQCNFVGSPLLTFTSANGAMVNTENGGDTVEYGIYLNDAAPGGPPSTWLSSGDAQTGVSYGPGGDFGNITTTTLPNTDVSPFFAVGPLESFDVAGYYTDVLTITIAP